MKQQKNKRHLPRVQCTVSPSRSQEMRSVMTQGSLWQRTPLRTFSQSPSPQPWETRLVLVTSFPAWCLYEWSFFCERVRSQAPTAWRSPALPPTQKRWWVLRLVDLGDGVVTSSSLSLFWTCWSKSPLEQYSIIRNMKWVVSLTSISLMIFWWSNVLSAFISSCNFLKSRFCSPATIKDRVQ